MQMLHKIVNKKSSNMDLDYYLVFDYGVLPLFPPEGLSVF